jgi:hypothetical protein
MGNAVMKRSLLTMCFAVLAASAALAQQKKVVPPPPKPADPGPNLVVTMKFIQDKVAEQGKLNFAVFTHDAITGEDGAARYASEVSNLVLDAANCRVRLESKFSIYGSGLAETTTTKTTDGWVKGMTESIQVMPADYWWKLELADEGAPSRTARVEPAYFVLSLGRAEKTKGPCMEYVPEKKEIACGDPTLGDRITMTWGFRDEDTANRVAKALVHAVELCGGGNKPEPF